MRKGIGCRVGNGQSFYIENEPSLPLENEPYVLTDCRAIRGQKVSFLISIDNNSWDTDLVQGIFDCRDINIILSTPLDKEFNDSWYWRHEKL